MFRIVLGLSFIVWMALLVGLAAALRVGPGMMPNGGQIAFESDRDGNWEVYTLDVRTSLAYNLTRNRFADHAPTWSPDGRQIAFHSNRASDADLYVMDAAGRHVRQITFTGRDWRPRWSPDGTRLLYIHGFNEIYVMNVDGSGSRYVTVGFGPEWSPDGRQIVYYVNQPNSLSSDIHLSDADGRNRRNLTNNVANDWGPSWLPDGNSVAFISSREGNPRVYVLDTACTLSARQPDTCVHLLNLSSAINRTPRWSPDGRQLAFDSIYQWQSQLYFVNADGTNLRRIRNPAGNDLYPVWSP
ncbi:MAG: PD40 domain-containing protein [Chloroflexi bacterium]|nr:PD40 domain-containing protein [Chloroflexota bacterium]